MTPPNRVPVSHRHSLGTGGLVLAIILGGVVATIVVHLVSPKFAKVKLVPFNDHGDQIIAPAGPLLFALELYPVVDLGNQELEKAGALIPARGD